MVEVTIGALAEAGALTFGDGYRTRRPEHGRPGYRILRVADVADGRVQLDGPDFVSDRYLQAIGPKLSQAGDVLLTTKGTVGRVAIYPKNAESVVYSPQLCYFRITDIGVIDARFLGYWFKSAAFARQASHRANNTDMAAYINLRDIASLSIDLPSIRDQHAVAEVLGALDDKIAANQRAAAVADQLVRARYEALGGDSVLLDSIAENIRDQIDPKAAHPETPYVGLEHVPRRSMWLPAFDYAAKVSSAKSAFRGGDVLFGKLRPYFHKVVSAPCDGMASTDILVLRAHRPELSGLLLAAASSDGTIAAVTASSEGTRMPRANG